MKNKIKKALCGGLVVALLGSGGGLIMKGCSMSPLHQASMIYKIKRGDGTLIGHNYKWYLDEEGDGKVDEFTEYFPSPSSSFGNKSFWETFNHIEGIELYGKTVRNEINLYPIPPEINHLHSKKFRSETPENKELISDSQNIRYKLMTSGEAKNYDEELQRLKKNYSWLKNGFNLIFPININKVR